MASRFHWAFVGLFALSCDKHAAAPPPTTAPTQPAATTAPEPAPVAAEDEPAGDEPAEADAEDEDADEAAADEGGEAESGPLTGAEAYQLAESAATEAMDATAFVLTPALPATWPPEGGQIVYYVYPLKPLESGVLQYRLGRATAMVTLTLADRSTAVSRLEAKGKPLGTIKLGRGITTNDPIHGGEEALFAVASGTQTPEKARFRLYRYEKWLEKNPLLARDVRKRIPAFTSFVEKVGR